MDAQGIFQLKAEALLDVNRIYGKQLANRFSLLENIDTGILYFKYLSNQYAHHDHSVERALAAWNWDVGNVLKEKPFFLSALPRETQDFIRLVLNRWKQCVREKNSGMKSARLIAITFLFIVFLVGLSARSQESSPPKTSLAKALEDTDTFQILEERILDFDRDGKKDHFYLVKFEEALTMYAVFYQREGESLRAIPQRDQNIRTWMIDDVNVNGKPDILIHFGYSGSAGFGTLVIYEWNGITFERVFLRSEIASTFGFRKGDIRTQTNELMYFYKRTRWEHRDHRAVYRWNNDTNTYDLLRDE